jgi:bifunctional DNA-binding transcriptional regulator/antitoxin component of YhaV-PrlF toxin-antitoxin module
MELVGLSHQEANHVARKPVAPGNKCPRAVDRGARLAKEKAAIYRVAASTHATIVRMDTKGRLTLPKRLRTELGASPGDAFFLRREGPVVSFVKAEDPFVALARQAIREADAGRTRNLREYAQDRAIALTTDE